MAGGQGGMSPSVSEASRSLATCTCDDVTPNRKKYLSLQVWKKSLNNQYKLKYMSAFVIIPQILPVAKIQRLKARLAKSLIAQTFRLPFWLRLSIKSVRGIIHDLVDIR